MSRSELYPLKFEPIIRPKIWGGDKLHHLLGKPEVEQAGESWELSGVPGHVSVVSEGPLAGHNLQELIGTYGPELLGNSVWSRSGEEFPLLFKFIDAKEDLSIQLHPDDAVARERHGSLGKTEMWYIMQADPGSRLIIDFDRPISKEEYLEHLKLGSLADVMGQVSVGPGDAYFIAPGTVHAIGGGVLLAEIQQSSDITYRLYDWDRPGTDGKMRELHTDQALDVIQFKAGAKALAKSDRVNEWHRLKHNQYFDVRLIQLDQEIERDLASLDSFVVYMCVEGQVDLDVNGNQTRLKNGETLLVPAIFDSVKLSSKTAKVIEVHVP